MIPFHVKDLNTYYGCRKILEDICFTVEQGTILGIAGPNGSGKSTLIRSMCNLIPHQGSCGFERSFEQMNEREISKLCSYLPQQSKIMLDMKVSDIVVMGFNPVLGYFQFPDDKKKEAALQVLKETGLEGKEECGFLSLSGGEKQLCLLARSLVRDTPLLFMDEPENSLDPSYRVHIMEIVRKRIRNRMGIAIISIHDIDLALRCCDRILLLHEGRIRSEICPGIDSIDETGYRLSEVFGDVCVRRVVDRKGREQLVMLR